VEFHNFVIDIQADVAIQQLVTDIYQQQAAVWLYQLESLLNLFLAIKFNVTYIL